MDTQNTNLDLKFKEFELLLTSHIEDVSTKLNKIVTKIDKMDKRIETIEKIIVQKPMMSDELRPLIKEKLNVDKNKTLITKLLNSHNIEADVKVFREFYIIKYTDDDGSTNYSSPIKNISARKYQYWNNEKWIDDMDAYYIKKVLIYNIQKLYLKINTMTNLSDDTDLFEENQKYIETMTSDKYNRLFIRELRSYLNIISI